MMYHPITEQRTFYKCFAHKLTHIVWVAGPGCWLKMRGYENILPVECHRQVILFNMLYFRGIP